MNRVARRWAALALLVLLARAAAGCGQTYDGSGSFYDQHPEYRNDPPYMHPGDPDDTSNDNKRF